MVGIARSKKKRTDKPVYKSPSSIGGRTKSKKQTIVIAVVFMTPAMLILTLFVGWPILSAFQLSFTDSSGFGDANFVWLANYIEALTSPKVLKTLMNTALYTVSFTPLAVGIALGAALLLQNRLLRGKNFFRTVLFLPFIVSLSVAAFAWTYLLDPQVGLLNYWFSSTGFQIGNVLQDPVLAMPTVVLVAIWKNFGFYMVIFIAGLQSIPESMYEAAKIDGAGSLRRFTSITVPQLSNTFAFVFIFAMIAALQAFDQIYVMTGGGPYRTTQTVVLEIYQNGFKDLNLGMATALSYILLAVTLLLSVIQFVYFGKKEEELTL